MGYPLLADMIVGAEQYMHEQTIADIARAIGQRWGLSEGEKVRLQEACDTADAAAELLWISVRLGDLFNDDAKIEREWVKSVWDKGLGGHSPLDYLLTGEQGKRNEIIAMVESVCGLE